MSCESLRNGLSMPDFSDKDVKRLDLVNILGDII